VVIRTSGEYRLSNFLLFEAAYAELLTLPLHHGMSDHDQDDVIAALLKLRAARGR
jgi:undecaprenyl diphosphate synthase